MTQAIATRGETQVATADGGNLPALVKALHEQEIPRGLIQHRPQAGRQVPYLNWRSVARVLDVVTAKNGGTWHSEIVSTSTVDEFLKAPGYMQLPITPTTGQPIVGGQSLVQVNSIVERCPRLVAVHVEDKNRPAIGGVVLDAGILPGQVGMDSLGPRVAAPYLAWSN